MDVLLIRHALAVDETLELRDPMRTLSAAGRAQATALGAALRARRVTPTHAWTSPLVRAVQTLELALAAHGAPCVVEVAPALAPDGAPKHVAAALRALPASAVVFVVGHEPGLSALGALLTRARDLAVIGKAEAVCVTDDVERWRVRGDAGL